MTNTGMTEQTMQLFLALARDAGNWDGKPMIGPGAAVDLTPKTRGNLTNLKRRGLITTFRHFGLNFAKFTPSGRALAESNGIAIPEVDDAAH